MMLVRPFWLLLGLTSTACGIAGVVLPLVPTTPFLLLAVYSFARSSPRLHTWLVTHPRFGPSILNWQQHGAISRRNKLMAAGVMVATLAISVALGVSVMILAIQAFVLGGVAMFVLSRPSGPQGQSGGAN